MQRICTSLSANGYAITLVGRKLRSSLPLKQQPFKQKRIRCWFNKGKWFYAEYNLRLFIWLLFRRMDAICTIDLDTIIPCYYISRFKRIPRIYDAHELFTELKEVITRPAIKKIWTRIENKYVPRFVNGYTVSDSIAEEFKKRYGLKYATIRNMPLLKPITTVMPPERFILYQGAVNEARGFEYLIPAMQQVPCKLVICGDGNFMESLKKMIHNYRVQDKVELRGMIHPDELPVISTGAVIGISLAEKEGLNQWLALPNKFFDYIHAGLPQVTMNYPEYKKINDRFEVAVLIDTLDPAVIATAINQLMSDQKLRLRLKENCLEARKELNWQQEEKKLLSFYQSVFNH